MTPHPGVRFNGGGARGDVQMERGTLTALAAGSALVLAGAAWVLTQGDSPVETGTRAVASARGAPAASAVKGVDARRLADSAGSRSDATLHDAAAPSDASVAFALVSGNLKCQIDRDADSIDPIKLSTDDALCDELRRKPLSNDEIYQAITLAAEQGHVLAQLHYAGYVAALFDDPRYALDPDFIRELKSNTVRFLEAAGRSGESEAYLRLSSIYSDGNLADGDPVLSYAYANAFFQAGTQRYAGKILHQSMDGLSPQELRRGNELSRHILDQRQSDPGIGRSAESR